MTARPSPDTLDRFAVVVGAKYAIRDPAAMEAYNREWRDLWHGRSPMVLRPASTGEVARILGIANETLTAIVPQSGNTGLVGGQIADAEGGEVVLSLDRMTRILDVDPANDTMTVEAGATLKSVREAAEAAGKMFPLSLASEGSCRIGGNLATNAGGLNVMAYGSARDLCLGLEVVLADGRVWNGLRSLRKDNCGYDLRNLFVGSEGTLGVITGAVLKLFPRPAHYETAFVALPSPKAAVDLLSLVKDRSGNRAVAFEIVPAFAMDLVGRHMGKRNPLGQASPWYVLAELADPPEGCFAAILEEALERGLIADATLAQSDSQRRELWAMRELMPEAQKFEGGAMKHDIAVPLSQLPRFLAEGEAAVHRLIPKARIFAYGHLGDGNIHYNVIQPEGHDKEAFLSRTDAVNEAVYGVVLTLGGSISAEHGIGRAKRHYMPRIRPAVELAMMRGVKRLLDPNDILSPGRVLPA
jgi:FAD/FMN-containing dehydrogenase